MIVVSLDGWSRIINTHPQFDGMRLLESGPGHDELPLYFECTIFRKDRKVATSVCEYMHEAHTGKGAWLTHPRRMLRHKAMVQCARICFGLAGIYDSDEAQRFNSKIYQSTLTTQQDFEPKDSTTPQAYKNSKSKNMGANFVKEWVKRENEISKS